MKKIFILLILLITGCSSTNNFEYSNLHSNNNKIFSLLSQIKVEGDNLYYKNQIYDINNIDGINFINLYKCFNLPDQKTNSNRIGNTVKVNVGFDIGLNWGVELVNDNIDTDLFNKPLECNKIKYNSFSYFDSPNLIQSSNNKIDKIQISKILRQYAIFSASLYILKKENSNSIVVDNYIDFIKFLNNNLIIKEETNNSLAFNPEVICVFFNLCHNSHSQRTNNEFLNKLFSINEINDHFSKSLLSIKKFYNINKNNFNDSILTVN